MHCCHYHLFILLFYKFLFSLPLATSPKAWSIFCSAAWLVSVGAFSTAESSWLKNIKLDLKKTGLFVFLNDFHIKQETQSVPPTHTCRIRARLLTGDVLTKGAHQPVTEQKQHNDFLWSLFRTNKAFVSCSTEIRSSRCTVCCRVGLFIVFHS